MPAGGYVLENGITLCTKHHLQAEKFHSTGGQVCESGFHPNDLYKLIDSSLLEAIISSKKLY